MNRLVEISALSLIVALTACGGGGGDSTTPRMADSSAATIRSTASIGMSPASTFVTRTITETPNSADAFVDSVGVNTHLFFNYTPYIDSYSTVRADLINLHIRHLRDGLADQDWQGYYDHLNDLATQGIHDDLTANLNVPMSLVQAYPGRLPHAIESIEGPNEIDNSNIPNWVSILRAYQQQLYKTVKSTPSMAAYEVVGPSFTSYAGCMEIGSLSGMSTTGNMHDYFSFRNPGTSGWGSVFPPYGEYGSLAYNLGIVQHVYNPNRVYATETGWDDGATYGATSYSVSAAVKARYTMRVLLEHWNAGVARTYLYELLDEGGQNFGLLSGNLAIKPAFTALSNLLGELRDPGNTFSPSVVSYKMAADPTVHHTLLQKRNGVFHLLLWVEVPAIDPAVPVQTATLYLPAKFRSIVQLTWQDTGQYSSTTLHQAADQSLSIKVTDRVTDLTLQL